MCEIFVEWGMADDASSTDPPPFENPSGSAETIRRVYDAVLHAREPMTVSEIAEQAACSDEAARTHLSFYVELGIVLRHEGQPVRYERNDEYFEWRRVNELVEKHTGDELQSRMSELTGRIAEYRDKYDADSPAAVNVLEVDAAQIDDVYIDLGDWETAIEERHLHERAQEKMSTTIDGECTAEDH